MLARRPLSTEGPSKHLPMMGNDRPDFWRDPPRLAPALSREIDRPEHELSVAALRGPFIRSNNLCHVKSSSNVDLRGVQSASFIRVAQPREKTPQKLRPISPILRIRKPPEAILRSRATGGGSS